MQANVHITPMRASRALALRYLATKFGTDTENITVSASSSCCCVLYSCPGGCCLTTGYRNGAHSCLRHNPERA